MLKITSANDSAACWHRIARVVVVVLATTLLVDAAVTADEIIVLHSRPGVTQRVLLWQPSEPDHQMVLLVFPGGGGDVGFENRGDRVVTRNPYLFSRQRDLLERPGVAIAVIEAPSDQLNMDSEFRRSAQHFADMTAVALDLKSRFPRASLVLLGHSRGTVSAAYVAKALGDRVSAVILISGFYERSPGWGPGLSEFEFDALKVPLLIVHHVKDRCPSNRFGPAQRLAERFPSIVVDGPDENRPDRPCAPGTNHWIAGREKETIAEIFKWIDGKTWSRLIR